MTFCYDGKSCIEGNTKECVDYCPNKQSNCSYQTKFAELDKGQTKERLEVIANCNTHNQNQLYEIIKPKIQLFKYPEKNITYISKDNDYICFRYEDGSLDMVHKNQISFLELCKYPEHKCLLKEEGFKEKNKLKCVDPVYNCGEYK